MPLLSRGFVRRRAISLATSLSVMATSFALAQNPRHGSAGHTAKDTDERQFLFGTGLAISDMNRGMLITPTGDIDRDFVGVMLPHNQGAIDMARAELKYGRNDELRQLARRIVSQQEQEISFLRHAMPGALNSMLSADDELASHAPN